MARGGRGRCAFGRGRGGGRGRTAQRSYSDDDEAFRRQRARPQRAREESSSEQSEGDGATVRTTLQIGGARIGGHGFSKGRFASFLPAKDSDDSDEESEEESGSSDSDDEEDEEEEEEEEDDDSSSGWSGELLEMDDASLADYAANAALEGGMDSAHALIATMALGGENARGAPRKARYLSESDLSDEEDEEEEEAEGRLLSQSAPGSTAAWKWGTGGKGGGVPSKRSKNKLYPGEKAKLRKEGIATKRAERAERAYGKGGFDAGAVADAMRGFVGAGGDMMALRPAGKFELQLTQQLATLFGLKCTLQGGTKKRFAVLHATRGSAVPDAGDERLALLLRGARAGFASAEEARPPPGARKRAQTPQARSGGGGGAFAKTPRSSGGATVRHSARVAFVSGGRIGGEDADPEDAEDADAQPPVLFTPAELAPPAQPKASNRGLRRAEAAAEKERLKLERRAGRRERDRARERERIGGGAHSAPSAVGNWGEFEAHTRGIGGKLLAKMGHKAGEGLGRDGSGISDPIFAVQRGKHVGLGAD